MFIKRNECAKTWIKTNVRREVLFMQPARIVISSMHNHYVYVFCVERASFDARSPGASFFHEQLPLRNAVRVANERRDRQFLRRARDGEQLQAGFLGQGLPFFVFTALLDQTRFSHASLPPRERG